MLPVVVLNEGGLGSDSSPVPFVLIAIGQVLQTVAGAGFAAPGAGPGDSATAAGVLARAVGPGGTQTKTAALEEGPPELLTEFPWNKDNMV